jgi:L-cysteine desulfidase
MAASFTGVIPARGNLEGVTGIEPAPSVWKTEALPLSYTPKKAVRYLTIVWDRLTEVVYGNISKNHRGVA